MIFERIINAYRELLEGHIVATGRLNVGSSGNGQIYNATIGKYPISNEVAAFAMDALKNKIPKVQLLDYGPDSRNYWYTLHFSPQEDSFELRAIPVNK